MILVYNKSNWEYLVLYMYVINLSIKLCIPQNVIILYLRLQDKLIKSGSAAACGDAVYTISSKTVDTNRQPLPNA